MLYNSLKIAYRTLAKHKSFSIIKILGLAVSISICLMIIIFIKDQKSSDQFQENRDRIVRIYTTDREIKFSEVKGFATTPGSLAHSLANNYPFVEEVVRLRQIRGSIIHNGEEMRIGGMYVEPSFFNVFSYRLKEGNPETALKEPYSIVISEEMALKFFGNDDPVNKILTFEKLGDFRVTGILEDLELKSHFNFDALLSFATAASLEAKGVLGSDMNHWSSYNCYYTYVLLRNEKDKTLLQDQLPQIVSDVFPEPENERFGLKVQALMDINLGINLWLSMPGTRKSFDIIFIPFLAALIVFSACFNYVNLSIAQSLKRAKEIGFRKVAGANRGQIIRLFLSETFVVTFCALIVSILIILWLIPVFNELDIIQNNKLKVNFQLLKDPSLYIYFILFAILLSILAGIFPALYLSSVKPVIALQGTTKIKGLSHILSRKILIGVQFAVSLIIIIITAYSGKLLNYWFTFDYGIKTENLVNVYLGDVNYQVFSNELTSKTGVSRVSLSNEIPIFGSQRFINARTETMEEPIGAFYYSIDPGFIDNFGLQVISGRNFSDDYSTEKEEAIIVNEEALKVFELGLPAESIGKTIILGQDEEMRVIGVVKDFNFYAPDEPIAPLILRYQPEEFKFANISYTAGMEDKIKETLKSEWEKLNKERAVSYQFMDDARQEASSEGRGIIGILGWVSGFIVFTALLGLFGMACYSTQLRIKEISIRKVFGAGTYHVVHLLSGNYLKLILYSAVFAIPVGYILSNIFYRSFAFRPELSLWIIPAALFSILLLALITISSQTVKAALTNPAEILRED